MLRRIEGAGRECGKKAGEKITAKKRRRQGNVRVKVRNANLSQQHISIG